MNKKIIIASSGQPSANPRLVKEALALLDEGNLVTVIYCPLSPWADKFDENLFRLHSKINWVCAGVHKKHFFLFFLARIRQLFWRYVFFLFGNLWDAATKSNSLFSQELKKECKKMDADIYIGHNIGALAAVVYAAKKYRAKVGFDFEDYHRGESIENSTHWRKIAIIENKFIPLLNFATASSPLISEYYHKHYPYLEFVTILNVFNDTPNHLPFISSFSDKIHLVWFSQFIGTGRGLENVIRAIGLTGNKNIILSLVGNYTEYQKGAFSKLAKENGLEIEQLVFNNPMNESELINFLNNQHIGIASEPGRDVNNDIALSNKIFMYLLSGNAVLFSSTLSQTKFYNSHSEIGLLYEKENSLDLSEKLVAYLNDRNLLENHRNQSKSLGKNSLNWQIEKEKLFRLIQSLFN